MEILQPWVMLKISEKLNFQILVKTRNIVTDVTVSIFFFFVPFNHLKSFQLLMINSTNTIITAQNTTLDLCYWKRNNYLDIL